MDPRAFLERWSSRPPLPPELDVALQDLVRLVKDRPELASPVRALGRLLEAAFQPGESGTIDESDLAAMIEGNSRGLPAFLAHAPRLDEATLVARSRRLAETLGPGHEPATAFLKAIRGRRLDLMACGLDALSGHPERVDQRAEVVGLEPPFVSSILRLALLPSLARYSNPLDRLRADGGWDRGDCPHCGSRPLLAESRGLEQRIFYRCGLCAADWPGERLRCPSCGENSPRSLDYSYVDGEQDRCRLAHCDRCRYDWKVVSTLTALSPSAMIVADLATVHLDLLAADRRGGSTV